MRATTFRTITFGCHGPVVVRKARNIRNPMPASNNAMRKLSSTKNGRNIADVKLSKKNLVSAFGIGSFAGVMGSLAGMGGGFVMIPLLTSRLVGLSQHTAHGTSLSAVAATGIAGAFGYGLNEVDLPAAAAIASFGIISARFGAAFSRKLSGESLKRAFGGLMICVAPIVPAKTYFVEKYGKGKNSTVANEDTEKKGGDNSGIELYKLIPAGMIGIGSGFLAGLFGVGGGTVVVPALTVSTDLSHYQALSTSLLAMTLPALSGTFTHYQKGNVAKRVALPLAAGSFVGAYVGGKLGSNVSEEKLRWGFSCLLVFLGAKSVLRM
uniref:Membrane transporter protein n=1 Tax=Leptocylindrus danicus TaxID=163516 RepID=A0A6U2NKE9_9STRA|mmetsp:Transcript_2188/g.3213  ORF Transcript_2188/g.3213 Transcript_2188/m.3213 type:complete len:323 (+) Transcript_2188:155-1123(+)